jgi:hypothetical protein
MSVETMAIINREEMEASCIEHIRNKDITVLIHFVGVAWLVTTRGSKGKLGNSVKSILCLRLCFSIGIFFLFRPLARLGVGGGLAITLAQEFLYVLPCAICRLGKTLIVGCRDLRPVSSLTFYTSLAWSRTMVKRLVVSLVSASIMQSLLGILL